MSTVCPGVREIRIHRAGEFRVLYVANLPEAVYVLSAFEKKTRKTPQRELELAADRFRSVAEERRRQRR
jgi:phage-related protein